MGFLELINLKDIDNSILYTYFKITAEIIWSEKFVVQFQSCGARASAGFCGFFIWLVSKDLVTVGQSEEGGRVTDPRH